MQEPLSDDDLTVYRAPPFLRAARQQPQPLWVWLGLTYACSVSSSLVLVWALWR